MSTKVQLKKNLTEAAEESALAKLLTEEPAALQVPELGQTITGTVLNANKKEVTVDLPGYGVGVARGMGLYHEAPDYANLQPGDEVEATVVDIENENGEVELSFRFAGHKKVWDGLEALRTEETILPADVVDANRGGLMVKVNKIPGFLPVSQLSPEHYPRVPGGDKNKILDKLKGYTGKKMDVKVITVDRDEEKLIVSEKAAWEEQQHSTLSQYKAGDTIEGSVTAVTDFGAFVEFGEKLEGLIHISELAWQRIDDPRNVIAVGDNVKAKIINIQGSKIFLSLKSLIDDPWKSVKDRYQIGQQVQGTVLKINPFGLFVELDPEIHGLAHISELSDKPVNDVSEIAKPGDTKTFTIVSIEPEQHRLGLSLKRKAGEVKAEEKEDKADKAEAPATDSAEATADEAQPATE